ncbi:MAG: saccharopine dehydrogenase family protein [Elusimicrobiota bacterium]
MMKFLVLGSGMQGRACAFDLLRDSRTKMVTLADSSAQSLALARRFLKRSPRLKTVRADASDSARVRSLAQGHDVIVSAVPYFLNLPLAKVAVAAKVHFLDLGGNTGIVLKELELHDKARKAGVTIIPDVGLGPGMTTTIAVHGMSQMDEPEDVFIRDGGLPKTPRPPMNYLLTFSEHGLINEYVEDAVAIRDFKRTTVAGLSEIEDIQVPGLGTMEAAHAAGGLSTLAYTCEGKIRTMDCKLIRYPGHCAVINAMRAMGFFDMKKRRAAGTPISPRELSAILFREYFDKPDEKDLVVVHSTVRGRRNGYRVEVVHDMRVDYDEKNRLTAMAQTTGFPAAIVAGMLARGEIDKAGAYPVEKAIPPEAFFAEIRKRGFNLSWTSREIEKKAGGLSKAPDRVPLGNKADVL